MNDISPNAIFLSSAFEPSPEELRAFTRSEKERSRPVQALPKPKSPSPRRPPPSEIVELSSDEEMPDFSQILAGSKKGVLKFSTHIHTGRLKKLIGKEKTKVSADVSFHAGPRCKS